MYLTLTREQAISCFDFVKAPDARLEPRVLVNEKGVVKEILVDEDNTDCFVINRIKLSDGEAELNVKGSYAVYIVTEGEGCLIGENYNKDIKKGDYFFMPACLMGKYKVSGNMEIVETY